MSEFLSNVFEWFRDPDNRGAAQVIGAFAIGVFAWASGLVKGLVGLFRPRAKVETSGRVLRQTAKDGGVNIAGNVGGNVSIGGATITGLSPRSNGSSANFGGDVGGSVIIGYSIEQHEAALERLEQRIRADLERAHTAERALLNRELEDARQQLASLEDSYKARVRELNDAAEALQYLSAGLPQAQLDDAFAALSAGDTSGADALFKQVQVMEAESVHRAAAAAYERGKLAASDIRWADAAEFFATAARLEPTFDHLYAAREYAWRCGDYGAALLYGEDLIVRAVSVHGQDSVQHATALNEHALSLSSTGRYGEAEPIYRAALAIREKALGNRHPAYAQSLNNLASLLHDLGRYDEAELHYREAMAINEQTLGKSHPAYATYLENLAGLLAETGRYDEAEPLYHDAVAINERTLGEAHPHYARSLDNLAGLLNAMGRYAEAERLHREAAQKFAEALGTQHPSYATCLNNLAGLLHNTGRYAEAEPLYREALEIDEKTLGKAHPDYASDLNNLAGLLVAMGRNCEAEPLYREALSIRTQSLGAKHPQTRRVAANVAALRAKLPGAVDLGS